MYLHKEPLCKISPDKRSKGDVISDKKERSPVGGLVRVERFRDGSAITHFGGMCGSLRTDKHGQEC